MMKRILTLLRSGRLTIVQQHMEHWGECDWDEHLLVIKKTLSRRNKAKTLIHECVHYLHPSFAEDTVLLIERDLWKHITIPEYHALLFHLGERT